MALKGSPELKARLKAIRLTFKVAGREWGEETADQMEQRVPVRTGRLRDSFRVTSATQRKIKVGGHYTAYFVDAGTKAHVITPKTKPRMIFQAGGRTIFAKKVNHPRTRAQRFRQAAALEALRKHPMADELVKLWNKAA